MNEEILIELGVVSDETKGIPTTDKYESLLACNFVDVIPVDCP